METFKLFIDNRWVEPASGQYVEVKNPCTGETVARVAAADAGDTDRAIEAAKRAFDAGSWSGLDYEDRAAYLHKVADALERRLMEFAVWESKCCGKPLRESSGVDIPLSVRALRYHADNVKALRGQVVPVPGKYLFDYVTYEPYGVVGAIAPWNFPLHLLTRSIGAALAAGNTVVCKAATATPVTAALLAECFEEAGVPAGVYNVVNGPGSTVGERLLSHDGVAMVSLTGSEEVGRRLMEASARARRIKKLSLELGGKSAMIVSRHADLKAAVNSCILGFCYNQGEVCVSTSRLLLSDEIYEPFMALLEQRAASLTIGDALSMDTMMGSLISEEHLLRVQGFVDRAVAAGGRLRFGGRRLTSGIYDRGSFYPPTVIEDVTPDMEIFQEEVFGPVLAVTRFHTLDEAVELANATRFALGAAIFSEDPRELYWTAERLDAGTVWMNCSSKSNIETPFGGNRNSGIGREDGQEGLLEYLKVKNHIQYVGKPYEDAYGFDA